ncbi:MAG: hypothetical protein COB17_06560 [Sulfurimonas sp.]|nr:MAG: hypothetical protein COB17_06560 [Sulfurimonas sp.]
MKYFSWLLGIIIGFSAIVYVLAFTSFGNALLKPFIEKKIQEQTKLDSKLDVFSLNMSEFEISLRLNSNNIIDIKGNYSLLSQTFDISYKLNLEELKSLQALTSTLFQGSFHTDGKVKGNMKFLSVDGKSDVASSDTTYHLELTNMNPTSIIANINNAKLEELLVIANQKQYASAIINLDVNFKNITVHKLEGIINTSIKNGVIDSEYITKAYKFKSSVPYITFNSSTTTKIVSNIADTKLDFNSNIVNFDVKSAKFNLNNKSIKSDFKATIANLNKLFFVTNQKMHGSIIVNGNIKKDKDLNLNIHTKLAGGQIDASLFNDNFKADLKGVGTMGLLNMFVYPEVFESTLNAKLNYNLAQSKGKISGQLVDGKFTKNKIFGLIKQYAKFDMYKEKFNGNINSTINKENLLISLELTSRKASITTKDTKLNTKTQVIDSTLKLVANNNPISATIIGNINKPKIKVDVNELVEKKIKDAVKKGINKLFKKFF